MGDIINAGADLLGIGPASKQADAMTEAARIGARSAQEATQLQREMWQAQQAQQQPWLQAGTGAVNRLAAGLAQGGEFATPFSQTNWMQDPGYAFRLSEGQKALDRSAAARGGLQSGAALKAAARYGQDMGSQEYQNAFNRYYQERSNMLTPLQSLAGVGQTSAQQLGAAGQNYANQANQLAMTNAANQGNLALGMGNVRASQYGNYGSALNTALNTDWNALGRRFGYGGGGGGMQAGGQVNPVSGEYMGSLEF